MTAALAAGRRGALAALALLTATAVAPLWATDPLPMQDLPNHLMKVDLLRRWLAGEPAARELYALNFRPVPNGTCYFVLLALSYALDLVLAARLFLTASVVALSVTAWRWVRRNAGHPALALVAPGMAFSAFTSKGFLNFAAALPMYLGALLLLTRQPFTGRDALALAALGLVLYFTHGFVFLALVATAAGWMVLVRPPWRAAAWRAAALLPGLGALAVWMAGGIAAVEGQDELVLAAPGSEKWWDALAWLLGAARDSPLAVLWLAAVAALVAGSGVALVRGPLRRGGPFAAARARPFLVLALAMGVLYLIGPDLSGAHARVRWLPIAVLTALGGLALPAARRLRAAVVLVLVAGPLWIHARHVQAFAAASPLVREYVQGLDGLEPGASLLPVDRERGRAEGRANLHTWAYYHIDRGGWGPYLHAWRAEHPIVYRALPWAPEEGAGLFDRATVRRAAACYDYVLVWDERGSGAAELAEEFELVRESPRLRLWRNRAGVRKRHPAEVPGCLRDARNGDG